MNRRLTSAFTALLLGGTTLVAATAPTQAAESAGSGLGTRSLATVLAADGHGFDKNARDFDVLDNLVSRVLAAKPKSRLRILTEGGKRVTAFMPTDAAFRRSAATPALIGRRIASERRLAREMWQIAGDTRADRAATVEAHLLFHLVPGKTLSYRALLNAAPTRLRTMTGGYVRVRVREGRLLLLDAAAESPNARVIPALKNVNKGNRQIGHGITWMMSPTGQ